MQTQSDQKLRLQSSQHLSLEIPERTLWRWTIDPLQMEIRSLEFRRRDVNRYKDEGWRFEDAIL